MWIPSDEAIRLVNSGNYGNQASLFTVQRRGGAEAFATRFRQGTSGSISGWRHRWPSSRSVGGEIRSLATFMVRGWMPMEFFTQKKVVVERWPKPWSRKF